MNNNLKDIEKTCKDCNAIFIFSAKDQAFFKRMVDEGKWDKYLEPTRCVTCRKKKNGTPRARV